MSADQKATDDMANIMQLLNEQSAATTMTVPGGEYVDYTQLPFDPNTGLEGQDVYSPYSTGPSSTSIAPRVSVSSGDTDAMAKILEAFNTAVTSEADAPGRVRDPEVKEAMVTERTHRGARVGVWEIVVNEGKSGNSYDVVSADGRTVIAKDLYVYDAAYGIAKRLNEGVAFNDCSVLNLLDLEADFARNRNDASGYKQRAKKLREKGEDLRASVAEDRHDEASRQALKAHEDILRLAGIRF